MAAPKGNRNSVKHGLSSTRLYKIWVTMRQRCNNPRHSCWKYYGAKGIKVCDEWNSFENFYEWSMKNGYEEHLTIDRRDTRGNYCPDNCRWATYKEQAGNKTNNKILNYNGESHTITEWSDITGIGLTTLSARLINGWSAEKALTTKVLQTHKRESAKY